MVFSRFWYLVLAAALAGVLFISYVGVGVINKAEERAAGRTLTANSVAVSLFLKEDAVDRANALVPLAISRDVGEALKKAQGVETLKEVESALRDKAGAALRKFREQPQEFPGFDALWAIDVHGRVVASDNFDKANGAEGFEMGGYPVVSDALHGYVRDDTWLFGDELWRIVARPVELEAGAAPVGAVVAGKKVDDTFARFVVERTGASLVFYASGRAIIKATPPSSETHLVGLTPEDIAKLEKLPPEDGYASEGRSKSMLVRQEASQDLRALFVRMPGEAWSLGAGYATMVQHPRLATPADLYSVATKEERAGVPLPLIGGLGLLAALVGILLSRLEHGGPLAGFKRGLTELADRTKRTDVLKPSTYRGPYKQLAALVNDALDKVASSAGVDRGPADLERVLGPLPAEPTMSAFAVKDEPKAGAVSGRAPGGAAAQAASKPRAPAIPVDRPLDAATVNGLDDSSARRKKASEPAAASVHPDDEFDSRSDSVDDENFDQSGERSLPDADGPVDEETEWRGVYEEFVALKKELGESVDKLTYQKFRGTLQRNKDALVARHGCERVSFRVYEKQGRAALKASPVK